MLPHCPSAPAAFSFTSAFPAAPPSSSPLLGKMLASGRRRLPSTNRHLLRRHRLASSLSPPPPSPPVSFASAFPTAPPSASPLLGKMLASGCRCLPAIDRHLLHRLLLASSPSLPPPSPLVAFAPPRLPAFALHLPRLCSPLQRQPLLALLFFTSPSPASASLPPPHLALLFLSSLFAPSSSSPPPPLALLFLASLRITL